MLTFKPKQLGLAALAIGTSVLFGAFLGGCPTIPAPVVEQEPEAVRPEAEEPEAQEPSEVLEPEFAEPEGTATECNVVELPTVHVADPNTFSFTEAGLIERGPGGLTRTGGVYESKFFDVSTGARTIGGRGLSSGLNADWTRRLSVNDANGLQLEAMPENEVQWSVQVPTTPAPEQTFVRSVVFSGNGRQAAALWCWSSFENGEAQSGGVLRVFNVDDGSTALEKTFDECADLYTSPTPILLARNGRSGVIVGLPAGALTKFDVDSGETEEIELIDVESLEEEDLWWPRRPILDVALSPDGRRVSVVTILEEVSMIDVDSGELLWTLPAARIQVNQMTYLPSTESPVAFSRDGKMLAFVGPTGERPEPTAGEELEAAVADILIVDSATGELISTRTMPINLWGDSGTGISAGAPMEILFDDRGLTVSAEGGNAHWECKEAPLAIAPAPLEVTLTGPSTIVRGAQSFELLVTTNGNGVAIRHVVSETNAYSTAMLEETLLVGVNTLDVSDISVMVSVDDGFNVVIEEFVVEVVD